MFGAGWRGAPRRQESLAVPTMSGEKPHDAKNPGQCQSWVARWPRAPPIVGSANAQWRESVPRQQFLAVPTLNGKKLRDAKNPWHRQF
jgi:hypothetical protein